MTSHRLFTLAALTLLAAPFAFAQDPAPAAAPTPPAPPSSARAPRDAERAARDADRAREAVERAKEAVDRNKIVITRNYSSYDSNPMGIVPSGTWWKNPDTVAKLSLTPDQQKRMDDIFRQNRIQLIDVKASLEKEQINLEPLLNANPVDTPKAMAEISRIADLRADLEKANAKMLLGLRAILSADQWTKLQADQHGKHGMPMLFNFKSGPGGIGPIGEFNFDSLGNLGDLQDRLGDLGDRLKAEQFDFNFQMPDIHIPEIVIPRINTPQIKMPAITIPPINFPTA